MAIGSILRGLGSKISGSALGRGAAGMGQRVASSPLGRGAANLGSAGANYAQLGYGKAINQIVRQFGVDEETAKRILMGLGGTGAVGAGLALESKVTGEPISPTGYDWTGDWEFRSGGFRPPLADSSGMVGKPMELDRFGFGVDARQLTDE